jgi:hypothetical protein
MPRDPQDLMLRLPTFGEWRIEVWVLEGLGAIL